MISHKLKFIFVHIPKTSGNSLSFFLKKFVDDEVVNITNRMGEKQGISIFCEKTRKNIKHHSITYYNNTYGEKINDYFKFTIVRNPYDRILSFYFWSKGENKQVFNRNEFINFIEKNHPSQHTYIDNSFHIIHFENLVNELKNIECFKGIVNFNNYPILNASSNSKRNYNEIFDKKLKDLVFNMYKKDFELFGYEY
tara:strand:- start:861 stop:1448 length:588 start_codon:yes stop_codon:yes gene_type:complete